MNVYDRLVGLPESEFEVEKMRIINEWIDAQPKERRAKFLAMQYNIEMKLDKSNDPMNTIFSMMWDSFLDLNEKLNNGVEIKNADVIEINGR